MTIQSHPQGHVVVGADGSERGYAGVRYAALEARSRGVALDIVNVIPMYVPVGPLLMAPDMSFESWGSGVLDRALEAARDASPDLEINSVLRAGNRVQELVASAREAGLLVLGARRLTSMDRVWTGATITGVSSRATCPVMIVPAAWEPATPTRRVVAGFKSPAHSDELFSAAFASAEQLGAELVVLHAWRLQWMFEDMAADPTHLDVWTTQQTAVIEHLLADHRDAYPDVSVRVEAVHDRPAQALVDASRRAERLVITRPAHGSLVHHLGSTARAVLREARCPIEVVPPAKNLATTPSPIVVEKSGDLVR